MRTARTALVVFAFLTVFAAGAQAQTTAFTYQGQLKDGGGLANGNYDFKFDLYDASAGGSLLGSGSQTLLVSSGIFTASLDFGNLFPGANRWLAISVRPSGGGSYTLLTPRQALQPAPYAIGLEMPFTGVTGSSGSGLTITNSNGTGLSGTSANGPGVSGVNSNSTSVSSAGVYGQGIAANGNGVAGIANNGASAYGVYGQATSGYAIYGYTSSGTGVYGTSQTGPGVQGVDSGSMSATSAGVVGESLANSGIGVSGIADVGVEAVGVYGESTSGYAGDFYGDVAVSGNLSKSGGSFKIDDPLDPANKYLYHSFVESPDMKDVYDGVVTTGADGFATVTLPNWFQVLNRDFRYQLTVIDDSNSPNFVQAKIVARVSNNQFTLRTSAPQTAVSWQVTGIRQDPWANAHRIPVEEEKTGIERGRYLHPELYGMSADLSVRAARAPAGGANRAALKQPAEKAPIARPALESPATNQ